MIRLFLDQSDVQAREITKIGLLDFSTNNAVAHKSELVSSVSLLVSLSCTETCHLISVSLLDKLPLLPPIEPSSLGFTGRDFAQ